jgi:hypothetical protein
MSKKTNEPSMRANHKGNIKLPNPLLSQEAYWIRKGKKKKSIYKDQEPNYQKYKANESASRHNPKKKQKQKNQQTYDKSPMQIRPMATKWWSTITKKTQDKRIVICHKLVNDEGELAIMCGRNEEPQPNAIARIKIVIACACCKAMDTCC